MAKRAARGETRICYQSFVHPVEQSPYIDRLQGMLDEVAAPGMRFEVQGLDPPDHSFHPLTEFRCAGQVIRNALRAEKARYDAFVLGHFQEPGLLEIRSSVDIPVIGLGEANVFAALSMGHRFGLVTIDRGQPARRLCQGAGRIDGRISGPLTATTQNRWLPTGPSQ